MEVNIKHEIITSYNKLINDCELAIEKGIDIEKNRLLLNEYNKILNQVKEKPANAYDEVIKEMKRVSQLGFE